jgi:hypothetical protein
MEEEEESSISELTEADTADTGTPLEPCPEAENWKVKEKRPYFLIF